MRKKTILLGMNNPYSMLPEHALYPAPPGCAGHRLWRMLHDRCGVTAVQYRDAFERRNLLVGEWDARKARVAADLFCRAHPGRRVVLLGAALRTAFRLPPVLASPTRSRGITFRQLPHPSGRCRWYNDPKNRALAGLLLEEEMRR